MSETIKMSGGDFEVAASGSVVTVTGLEKCAQDIAESLLNAYDSLDPYYYNGSEFWQLDDNAGAGNMMGIEMTIESMAAEAIERLMAAQEDDAFIDDDELIDVIEFIRVWKIGPMSYAFHAHCVTDSTEHTDVGFDINLDQQLPSTVDPTGTTVPGRGAFL